jgi:hypothetical protein
VIQAFGSFDGTPGKWIETATEVRLKSMSTDISKWIQEISAEIIQLKLFLTKYLGCVRKNQKSEIGRWISLVFLIGAVRINIIGFGMPKSTHCCRLIAKNKSHQLSRG